jgi:hypothetical protein
MKLFIYSLFVVFLFFQCNGTTESKSSGTEEMENTMTEKNSLSEEEKEAGWVSLFDGKSTDLWRGYNRETFPTKGWKVENDELWVIFSGTEEEGFGGDIITKEKYENFEFQLDFMLTDTANSGILYRVVEMENTPIWHNAPEFQLLDDETYVAMGGITPMQLTAANYDMHVASGDYSNPIGGWNTASVKIQDNTVEHWLNGQKTVEYELGSEDWTTRYRKSKFSEYPGYGMTKMGHIGLQDHGHTVKFRNIKVRKL